MRQRSIHGWAATLLIAVAVALPAIALAQDEQSDPRQGGVAFAGGQMVRGTVTAAEPRTSPDSMAISRQRRRCRMLSGFTLN